VIFYHAILHLDFSLAGRVLYQPIQNAESWSDVVAKAALMLMNGESAVFLFFVLSGCVLRLSIERGDREVGPLRLGASFALARLLGLYPPVIVCMIGSHAVLGGLIIGLISLLATAPFAVASERWVERPSIKVGRAVTA
jgi:peptidoglycan/LPS O-acetylase OafA/YrhL